MLVTVAPFGETDPAPIRLLQDNGIAVTLNDKGRRLSEEEVLERIAPYEVLLAGTEPLTPRVLDAAPNLRLIAKSGIGLDNLDLNHARRRGVAVTYTPSAPTAAVSELTIAQMIALLRHTPAADRGLRRGIWRRSIGRGMNTITAGVIGVGRVGRSVIRLLQPWNPARILAADLVIDAPFFEAMHCTAAGLDTIYREADVITVHVPLTARTRRMIGAEELARMKPDAVLINTARGGIVDETALAEALAARPAFSAAVDVFVEEPYSGPLTGLDNCLLTCHMGSATRESRLRMESEAAMEVVRYFRGEPQATPVPDEEYAVQAET